MVANGHANVRSAVGEDAHRPELLVAPRDQGIWLELAQGFKISPNCSGYRLRHLTRIHMRPTGRFGNDFVDDVEALEVFRRQTERARRIFSASLIFPQDGGTPLG